MKRFRGVAGLFEEFPAGSMLGGLAFFHVAARQLERHSANCRPELAHEHEPTFMCQRYHADIVFRAQRVMGGVVILELPRNDLESTLTDRAQA